MVPVQGRGGRLYYKGYHRLHYKGTRSGSAHYPAHFAATPIYETPEEAGEAIDIYKRYAEDEYGAQKKIKKPKIYNYKERLPTSSADIKKKYLELEDLKKKQMMERSVMGRYTEKEKKRAIELALEYGNISKAARELNINDYTVGGWLKDSGKEKTSSMKKYGKTYTEEEKKRAMELALKYDHISKAARELKIAKSTVSAWLRDAGKKTTTWKKYGKTNTEDELSLIHI